MKELHRIVFSFRVRIPRVENREEFLEKGAIGLDIIQDLNLVEENQGIEDGKSRVVQNPCQNHILQVLQAPCTPNLFPYDRVLDGNDFLEAGFVCEVLSVVGFVGRELGVIY